MASPEPTALTGHSMLPTAARAPSEPPRPRAATSADRHLADLGWRLEVEGEADMWGPHVSNQRDLFFFPNMVICIKIRSDVWAWMVGDVENGKNQVEEELQWQISEWMNYNGVSPNSKNCNGMNPNNPKRHESRLMA
jgi:hypothetical protein